MVDLAVWTEAALKRFEKYQNDRGEQGYGRRVRLSGKGAFDVEKSAGYEFADIADRLPPL